MPYGDKEIVLFIGHSEDARAEAAVIRGLEEVLQGKVDLYKTPYSFDRVKFFLWDTHAAPDVGGQRAVISPIIQRANAAVFVFKKRIGETTWQELLSCIKRNIPIHTFFATAESAGITLSDHSEINDWHDLLVKRESLTKDWNNADSVSFTPQPEYTSQSHLQQIAVDRLEKTVATLLGYGSGRFRVSTEQVKPDALSYIDRDAISQYKAALRSERSEALRALSDEEFLVAQGCIRDGALTTAGKLLFTAQPKRHLPSAFVRAIKYKGSDKTTERAWTVLTHI
jgi:hypothetical protein